MSGHGRVIRAHAAAPDPLVAVDLVVEKLEHQLGEDQGPAGGPSQSFPARSTGVRSARTVVRRPAPD